MNEIKVMINNLYGWSVEDGKAVPPKFQFPDCVWERINYFVSFMEDELTFQGILNFVLAEANQKELEEQFKFGSGADWLPVTEEFIKWRDTTTDKTPQIAVALLYGEQKQEKTKWTN